jgi:hypothetical protein
MKFFTNHGNNDNKKKVSGKKKKNHKNCEICHPGLDRSVIRNGLTLAHYFMLGASASELALTGLPGSFFLT